MPRAVAAIQQTQAADLAGLTVQGMVACGRSADPPPKGSRGYPPREFGEWLKRRHLRGIGVNVDGVVYDYEQERARLTKAQADRTELEAAELRGELVRVADLVDEWGRMLGAVRARLLSLPSKAAPRVRGAVNDEEAASLLEVEVIEALEELSADGLPDRTRARRQRIASRAEAAAEADGERVGGRGAAPVAGKRGRAG